MNAILFHEAAGPPHARARHRRVHGLAALLLAAVLGGCASSSPAPGPREDAGSALRVGDGLRITVWRKPEYSGEFTVGASGGIADPFYMDVGVVGVSLAEITERVRRHVARYEQDPRVLVQPLVRISVAGEVREPNLYNVAPEVTLAQAVMVAGGPTELGDLGGGVVWRLGREMKIDLTRPNQGLAGSPVQSGDQILVLKRKSFIRDYVAPAGSVIGAAAAIANILLRSYW
jgi:polysaccharide export outer membrane protein